MSNSQTRPTLPPIPSAALLPGYPILSGFSQPSQFSSSTSAFTPTTTTQTFSSNNNNTPNQSPAEPLNNKYTSSAATASASAATASAATTSSNTHTSEFINIHIDFDTFIRKMEQQINFVRMKNNVITKKKVNSRNTSSIEKINKTDFYAAAKCLETYIIPISKKIKSGKFKFVYLIDYENIKLEAKKPKTVDRKKLHIFLDNANDFSLDDFKKFLNAKFPETLFIIVMKQYGDETINIRYQIPIPDNNYVNSAIGIPSPGYTLLSPDDNFLIFKFTPENIKLLNNTLPPSNFRHKKLRRSRVFRYTPPKNFSEFDDILIFIIYKFIFSFYKKLAKPFIISYDRIGWVNIPPATFKMPHELVSVP